MIILNKINLLIIKNPITREVERKQAPYVQGYAPFDYIYPHFMLPEGELEVFYGGKQLTELQMRSLVVRPDDYIVAMPKVAGGGGGNDSKNILSMVAMIVITMYAGPMAGQAASTATGAVGATTAAATWNFWGYAAALGVQAAGGYLLNYFAKKNLPETEQGSPTYGWDNVRPLVGQGQPVPVVLGTVKAAGQIIAQHVISDGTKQYLNLLIQCGEGPCDYIGTGEDADCIGIDNIKINNNPLSNYTGITTYKRAGLNNQSVIPNFEDTRIEQAINIELEDDSEWHTFTTTSDTGSGLEVTFMLPGLYYVTSKGKRYANEIRVEIEYKPTGESDWIKHQGRDRIRARRVNDIEYGYAAYMDGDQRSLFYVGRQVWLVRNGQLHPATVQASKLVYLPVDSETEDREETRVKFNTSSLSNLSEIEYIVDYVAVEGKYLSQFSKSVKIDAGTTGQYDVRCRCVYKLNANDNDGDAHRIYWSKLSHIVYDDFIYPNKTLLAIEALANDQISGSANVTFELTRSKVWVWVPDDPDLDPWGAGSYQEMPANNPAWASYWLNHRVYRYWDINANEWVFVVRGAAKECMVYNDFKAWADFCDDKGITCNIYFDTIQKLREAMQTLEDLGRGRVLPKGTKIGCMFDGPAEKDADEDIVYSQVFNVANIGLDSFSEQWVDVSERATAIEVTFWNADNNHEKEVMLVPADGLTEGTATGNVTQLTIEASVPREVAWKHCKYKLRLNNYINNTVNITTSINAIVSDLGQVIGVQHDVPQWGYGGRVVSATTTTITLDKPVVMEADKTYTALFWLNNDEKIEKLIVTEPGETSVLTISEPFDNDTLEAEYVDSNLFWVDGDQELLFPAGGLTHLFHSTGDWTEYVISAIYDSEIGKTLVEVTNCPEDLQQVRFAWTMPHENDQWLFGPVEDGVKKHSRPFKIMGFTRENDLIYRITAVNYEDAVYTESETVPDIDYSSLEPIFEVEDLAVEEETFSQDDGTLVSTIICSWDYPIGKTPDECRIYYSEDGGLTWIYSGSTVDTKYIIQNVKTGIDYLVRVHTVKIPITSVGVVSLPAFIEGKDTPPGDVPEFNLTQVDNVVYVNITEPPDPDIKFYEIRMGPSWDNSAEIKRFSGDQTNFTVSQEGTQTYWIKAYDRSLNPSENATPCTITIFALPVRNVIAERTFSMAEVETVGMYTCPFNTGCAKIDSVEKIEDYEYFCDAFANGHTLRTDAEAIPPAIDLGQNVVQEGYFYYDDWGKMRLMTVETLSDNPTLWTIFNYTWEHVAPQFKLITSANVDIDYEQKANNFISLYHRTSFDGVTYDDWAPLTNHRFFGRYWQPKLLPGSRDGLTNVYLCGVTVKIDVPDLDEKIPVTAIAGTGATRITLQKRFYAAGMPELVALDENGKQCILEIVGNQVYQNEDGSWYFDVRLWDLTGAVQIAGSVHGTQRGY